MNKEEKSYQNECYSENSIKVVTNKFKHKDTFEYYRKK